MVTKKNYFCLPFHCAYFPEDKKGTTMTKINNPPCKEGLLCRNTVCAVMLLHCEESPL